jgi:hypothetical protein
MSFLQRFVRLMLITERYNLIEQHLTNQRQLALLQSLD